MQNRRVSLALICAGVALLTLLVNISPGVAGAVPPSATPEPQPIDSDRLAIPVLPELPTEIDRGRVSYYYNCMPCHGDKGQGLTDEFRGLWVEDHQNCWARGCHGGREGDEGYPLPAYIPPVSSPPQTLQRFSSASKLYDYLRLTHPPQRPGALSLQDYWALTEFLMHENSRPVVTTTTGLADKLTGLGAVLFSTFSLALLMVAQTRRKS